MAMIRVNNPFGTSFVEWLEIMWYVLVINIEDLSVIFTWGKSKFRIRGPMLSDYDDDEPFVRPFAFWPLRKKRLRPRNLLEQHHSVFCAFAAILDNTVFLLTLSSVDLGLRGRALFGDCADRVFRAYDDYERVS